jgi:hypothetical protein
MTYIHVVCPSCHARIRFPNSPNAAAKLKCPRCQSTLHKPTENNALALESVMARESRDNSASYNYTNSSQSTISEETPEFSPLAEQPSITRNIIAFVSNFFYRLLTEKTSVASLTSLLVHCALILFLGVFIVLPELRNNGGSLSLSAAAIAPNSNELVSFDMMPEIADQQLESMSPVQSQSLEASPPELSVQVSIDVPEALNIESTTAIPIDNVGNEVAKASVEKSTIDSRPKQNRQKSVVSWIPTMSKKGIKVQEALLVTPKDGVSQIASASGAADSVMEKLRGSIGQAGPVAIVWLMDASLSLVEERRQLAPQVYSFYESLKANAVGSKIRPKTSIFAFGQNVVPVQRNLDFLDSKEVANAIHSLPIDETGNENVLSALSLAIGSIPNIPSNLRIEVVIWTDESGDDLAMLEDAIQLCRYRNARVHVVGPLSVFGMEKGLQQFTLPEPNRWSVLLPVKRGPDSAFPERAQLPLWHESQDVDWGSDTLIPAEQSAQNLGGPHRQLLLAPSGPYALTRLALATGGSYTALNRAGDLAAAGREQLFDYMPDYRSGWEIAYDIDKYPLRRAIIEAAALTGTINYWPPQRAYPSNVYNRFPYNSYVFYVPPTQFPRELKQQLAINVQRLLPAQKGIEQAIELMLQSIGTNYENSSSGEAVPSKSTVSSKSKTEEMSAEFVTSLAYQDEKSPRWRAWYDLNLGRLLCHSVRIAEYIERCIKLSEPESTRSMLDGGINSITLNASPQILGGVESVNRAQTAIVLLERVIKEHPNTPWSDLATWELQSALGIEVSTTTIPPPVVTRMPLPAQPRPSLPRL